MKIEWAVTIALALSILVICGVVLFSPAPVSHCLEIGQVVRRC